MTLTNGSVLNLGNIKGADGIGILKSEINADGELLLTYSDNTTKNLGKITGTNGANGADGVGIKNVTLSSAGDLSILMTDNSVYNLGNIKGEKGEKGDPGEKGEKGDKGDPGENGKDGRGIAGTKLVNGELVITYTDGTSDNLGKINSDSSYDEYLMYNILSDTEVSVSIRPEYAGSFEGKLVIPDEYIGRSVTAIATDGFKNCNITEIVLPSKLTTIYAGAFSGCKNLKSIVIPQSVNLIQYNAFINSGLKKAKFENTVNWKKYSGLGLDAGVNVSSSDLSNETKAAQLLTETYYYDNPSLDTYPHATHGFSTQK